MVSNKNIFCATNPAHMIDALGMIIDASNENLADMLIFLPSRRAVRTVEKYLARRAGGATILPHLVALGEGVEDETENLADIEIIKNTERVIRLSQLLSADATIGSVSNALPIARDLVKMMDYMENEGVNVSDFDWSALINDVYPEHFRHNANLLNILAEFTRDLDKNTITDTARRKADIRAWRDVLDKYKLVIVCASTASVPATADLMRAISQAPNGRIILSGLICGRDKDFELTTNPYYSEYKFLKSINVKPDEVIRLNVGPSDTMDFFNYAFGNNPELPLDSNAVNKCHLIECNRESEEAAAVIEIARRAIKQNKSVLVITPDAAGNQRLASELMAHNISADFSGSVPGTMTVTGRAILNCFDDWAENKSSEFKERFAQSKFNLADMLIDMVDTGFEFSPNFDYTSGESVQIWQAICKMADIVQKLKMQLNVRDARALLSDAISSVPIRSPMNDNADVVVLGTIESRMQTADVIILTGLNEGMFPTTGYETSWLPRKIADKIGLPSPNRKISLMSLDFMNLSCGAEVYWLRSLASGGAKTTESRFISRIVARGGKLNKSVGADILAAVRSYDDVPYAPAMCQWPRLTVPDKSDIFVTELDYLINNPYAFYVKHILRLKVLDDFWQTPDARNFGTLVHDVIQHATDTSLDVLVAQMDAGAEKVLGTKDGALFRFWHNRFVEIAPYISQELKLFPNTVAETEGFTYIAGRKIRAIADRIWDGGVMDIKTGSAPTKSELSKGDAPQLPLEAYMLQNNGFELEISKLSQTPIMRFLQLKKGDAQQIEYDADTTKKMIEATIARIDELLKHYENLDSEYAYSDDPNLLDKYKTFDDLARRD